MPCLKAPQPFPAGTENQTRNFKITSWTLLPLGHDCCNNKHELVHNYFFFVFQSGLTPLHLTAQEDRVRVAEILVKHDANIDQQTKVSLTRRFILLWFFYCTLIFKKNNLERKFQDELHFS